MARLNNFIKENNISENEVDKLCNKRKKNKKNKRSQSRTRTSARINDETIIGLTDKIPKKRVKKLTKTYQLYKLLEENINEDGYIKFKKIKDKEYGSITNPWKVSSNDLGKFFRDGYISADGMYKPSRDKSEIPIKKDEEDQEDEEETEEDEDDEEETEEDEDDDGEIQRKKIKTLQKKKRGEINTEEYERTIKQENIKTRKRKKNTSAFTLGDLLTQLRNSYK